jgi:predicted 3-demethylubiquinone-9 3-methyltransferase (glyoxalase superfamily)
MLKSVAEHREIVMATLQRFSTCLWFDRQAEDAARHYVSIFKNSSIGNIARYGKAGFDRHHMPEGSVMTVAFTLDGREFLALNGGPLFKFNEAVSLMVNCANQDEIDYYWDKLGAGGDPNAKVCGWLKDKFGLSWQIVPADMAEMMGGDPEKANRAMAAVMQMKKLDIDAIWRAYNS